MAVAYLALFLASFYTDLGDKLVINAPAAVASNVSAIVCLIFFIWNSDKHKNLLIIASFLSILTATALAILDTGGVNSPFLAVWIMLSAFAVAFGVSGWLPILLSDGVFITMQYLGNDLSLSVSASSLIFCILPLIVSAFIWRARGETSTEDKSYQHLASALNEVASKSEVVINAIGDGVMAIDSQGVIQLINPAAQEITGWTKQDAMTLNYKTVLKLVDNKDEAVVDANDPVMQALNSNQQLRSDNLNLLTKSGKKLMIYLVISPVGEAGAGVIIVFRDITKEKTEERQQAEFISTASHEMRTPVASIEGYLGLALNPQTATVDERAKEFINKAHQSAQHLGRLFQDLLDISKADDGRISNNPKVVNLVPFVSDIIQGLSQKANEKHIQLIYRPNPADNNIKMIAPEFTVNLDNDHIREIISNLVENAIKYTKQGSVTVDISGDNEHVIVSVKDTGIGIPAEDIPHLFQKFYRVDDKDTREIGGTGLGLYLSRRLSEILGGRMWVESAYGSGSTFYLELPRISSNEANMINEQQAMQASIQNINKVAPEPTLNTPIQPEKAQPVSDQPKLNTVPRGEALTQEQKAALVAKQRELIQQQNGNQTPNN